LPVGREITMEIPVGNQSSIELLMRASRARTHGFHTKPAVAVPDVEGVFPGD